MAQLPYSQQVDTFSNAGNQLYASPHLNLQRPVGAAYGPALGAYNTQGALPGSGSNLWGGSTGLQGSQFSNTGIQGGFSAGGVGLGGGGGLWGGMGDMFGKVTPEGLGMGADMLLGLGKLGLGFKQYGQAKKQLKFARNSFNKNYAAQRQTTNASLRDRQSARVASNPGAYQSVGDYMQQNQVAA